MKSYKAIVAMARNRVIGAQNKMPWHLPEDLRWFAQTTSGHIIVMGRKTFESIGGRPLPGRRNIIVSRKLNNSSGAQSPRALANNSDVEIIDSLDKLQQLTLPAKKDIWICGGAEIYRQTFPYCSDIFLTLVKRDAVGDAWLPPFEHAFDLKAMLRDTQQFSLLHYINKKLNQSATRLKLSSLPSTHP